MLKGSLLFSLQTISSSSPPLRPTSCQKKTCLAREKRGLILARKCGYIRLSETVFHASELFISSSLRPFKKRRKMHFNRGAAKKSLCLALCISTHSGSNPFRRRLIPSHQRSPFHLCSMLFQVVFHPEFHFSSAPVHITALSAPLPFLAPLPSAYSRHSSSCME